MAFPLIFPKLSTRPPLLLHHKSSQNAPLPRARLCPSPVTKLESPPLREEASAQDKPSSAQDKKKQKEETTRDEFYLNVGMAVRTLRDDIPSLFHKDLNYDIYREDITFIDPLNTFQGIENYRLIFWALRFHGRILFKEINIEVYRVWQPSENSILIRWELQGVPRVPWEARGQFQGTSRYKVDRNGKIYEHKVDNLAFNFPRTMMRSATVLDLVGAACPATPNLTFRWDLLDDSGSCPWIELYRAVRGTLEQEGHVAMDVNLEGLVTCL